MSLQKDFSQASEGDIRDILDVDRDVWKVKEEKTKKVYKRSRTKLKNTITKMNVLEKFKIKNV